MYDKIVIGGGISGLYYVYRSLQKNPDEKILLLEKDEKFGGRIQTFSIRKNHHLYTFEEGAARFNQNHKHLIHLIHELGLQEKMAPIPADIHFQPVNPKYDSHFNPFEAIQKVEKYVEQHPEIPLDEYSYLELIRKYHILSPREMDHLRNSFGYTAELTLTNAQYAIELFRKDFSPKNQFYGLQGGLSQIIHRLVQIISQYPQVSLSTNSFVKKIEYKEKKFRVEVNGEEYESGRLVMAMPKPALKKFRILRGIRNDLDKIRCIALLRYYSIYKRGKDGKYWFEGIGKTTTDHWMRYIIPVDKKKGLVMTSYTDWKFAKQMKKRIDRGEDEKEIEEGIEKIFGKRVGRPIYTKMCYFDCGVGLWKKGKYDYRKIAKKMIRPFSKMKLNIVGENYSLNQGWIEGALETVDRVL